MRRTDEIVGCFLIARDDADGQPRATLDLTDSSLAVLGISQCRRRESHHMRDVEIHEETLELRQDLHRLIDALLLHDAILEIRRQPHRMFLLHEHLHMCALDEINRHAHRVGANINHPV